MVSPKSFLQVNDKIRDAIYDYAAALLDGFDGDIIELYSGVGLLTAQLALRLPKSEITAVEIEHSASRDANELMRSIGLSNRVCCICDDAKHFCQNMSADGRPRALILDPPRRGCDREVLESATNFDRIVYISCNPQTLARDLKILSAKYEVLSVKPFDMFPQTGNIECVAFLKSATERN